LNGKNIIIIRDESQFNNRKLINILASEIEESEKIHLLHSVEIEDSPNHSTMSQKIDDTLKDYGIARKNFVLLISDSARYMVKSGKNFKVFYSNMSI